VSRGPCEARIAGGPSDGAAGTVARGCGARSAHPPPSGREAPGVVQPAAPAGPALERLEVERDGEVRPLAGDRRAVGAVHPLTADLSERVGAPLRRRAPVERIARRRRHDGAERGDDDLSGLRVQIPVHAHHPVQRRRDVETPPIARSLGVPCRRTPIDRLAPVVDRAAQLAGSEGHRRLDERLLDLHELGRVDLTRRDEHRRRRGRDLARRQRLAGARHPPQPARDPHLLAGDRPRAPQAMDEPGRHRQVPVAHEGPAGIELRHATQTLRLERAAGALDLDHVLLERLVRREPQVLAGELVEGRQQHAHTGTLSNVRSWFREIPHTWQNTRSADDPRRGRPLGTAGLSTGTSACRRRDGSSDGSSARRTAHRRRPASRPAAAPAAARSRSCRCGARPVGRTAARS
jgi:hypothetical protein